MGLSQRSSHSINPTDALPPDIRALWTEQAVYTLSIRVWCTGKQCRNTDLPTSHRVQIRADDRITENIGDCDAPGRESSDTWLVSEVLQCRQQSYRAE